MEGEYIESLTEVLGIIVTDILVMGRLSSLMGLGPY
jgi:hypothetical protein